MIIRIFTFSLSLFLLTGSARGEKEFKIVWDDGISFESEDGDFQFSLGGRIHNDWAFIGEDDALEGLFGNLEDGTEFRRARLEGGGTFYRHLEFKLQFDFASGDVDTKDLYLGLTGLPGVGRIRFGHLKEPFSLEQLTSSNNTSFLERGLLNALVPGRNTGILAQNTLAGSRVNWAIGLFKDSDDTGLALGDDNYAFTARLAGQPWHQDDGRRLVHLGIGYSRRNPEEDSFRFRQRPEAHLAPHLIDSESQSADSVSLIGLEGAVVVEAFSFQTEFVQASAGREDLADPEFSGFYAQATYTLTGESRSYSRTSAAFGSVEPENNFMAAGGGAGAWEIAVRYSRLELDDLEINRGRLKDFTLGLNWYLNPNARIMWNYIQADRDPVGEADIFQMRLQLNF